MSLSLPSPAEWRDVRLQPWGDGALIALALGWTVALAAVVGGWFGSSGTANIPTQMNWLCLAAAGVIVSGVTNCVWLMVARRAVGLRRHSLVSFEPASPVSTGRRVEPGSLVPAATGADHLDTAVLSAWRVEGQSRVHRADCALLAGKAAEPVALGAGPQCRVCQP